MAPTLSWLSTCKASQLKTIASLTGINSSGTKPILISRLLQDLPSSKLALYRDAEFKNHNIVSIDMGIRNLAYCRISVPNDWTATTTTKTTRATLPTVKDWTRLAISQQRKVSAMDDISLYAPKSNEKETFDPATYSQHAHDLISSLLVLNPTQILIERQRFRSMGGSAVQEWTLRVNMFESMLYAVLKTYSARNLWSGAVYPVAPGKVSKFWLGDAEGSLDEKIIGSKSAKTKLAKIELVEKWLDQGERFKLEGKAGDLGRKYLEKRNRGKKKGEEGIGKLDDLADCLLQGMAWIKWEENRIAIVKKGPEVLDELESF